MTLFYGIVKCLKLKLKNLVKSCLKEQLYYLSESTGYYVYVIFILTLRVSEGFNIMSMTDSLELQEEQHSEPYYTKAQIIELLGISEHQVYEYVKKKKIRPLPNPYKMRKESVYYRKEVDLLTEERKALANTFSVSEAAKKLGISRQRIDYIIRTNSLDVEYIQLDKAKRIRIPESTMLIISEIVGRDKQNSLKYQKATYYNEKLNIAIYQLFSDDEGNQYRIALISKQWGLIMSDGTFIEYEDALKTINLKKEYGIEQPLINESNYTVLMLPKHESITWSIFDYFLSVLGVHNISIREHEEQIELQVKQGIIDLVRTPLVEEISQDLLNECVVAGEIIVTDHELFLVGKSHPLRATISIENYRALCSEAEAHNETLSRLINKILTERYK